MYVYVLLCFKMTLYTLDDDDDEDEDEDDDDVVQ